MEATKVTNVKSSPKLKSPNKLFLFKDYAQTCNDLSLEDNSLVEIETTTPVRKKNLMTKSKLSNLMDFANNEVEKITYNPLKRNTNIQIHNETQESLRSVDFNFPKTTKHQS